VRTVLLAACLSSVLSIGCDDALIGPNEAGWLQKTWVDAAQYDRFSCALTDTATLRCGEGIRFDGVLAFDGGGDTVCVVREGVAAQVLECRSLSRDSLLVGEHKLGDVPIDVLLSPFGVAYVLRADGKVARLNLGSGGLERPLDGLVPLVELLGVGFSPSDVDGDTRVCGLSADGPVCADGWIFSAGGGLFEDAEPVGVPPEHVAVLDWSLATVVGDHQVVLQPGDRVVDLEDALEGAAIAELVGSGGSMCARSVAGGLACGSVPFGDDPPIVVSVIVPEPVRAIRVDDDGVGAVLEGGAVGFSPIGGPVGLSLRIVSERPDDPQSPF